MIPQDRLRILTMVVDESDYLAIWLAYWRRHVPDDCLHILCHGENPALRRMAEGVRFEVVPRPAPYPEMEEDRWAMLSERVSALARDGFTVIYTDVDEILVADPWRGRLVDKLLAAKGPVAQTLGLEVIHRTDLEPDPIRTGVPILRQRQYYRTTSFYAKPCIVTAPVRWGRGGHYADAAPLRFVPGLYTVHLRFYDMGHFRERARVRRLTTQSSEALKAVHHRRWRNSAEGVEDVIAELQSLPLPRLRSLSTLRLSWRIRRTRRNAPDAGGLYSYELFTRGLQRFPRRFLDLL